MSFSGIALNDRQRGTVQSAVTTELLDPEPSSLRNVGIL
jgi:hypothetical protein